MSVHDSQPGDIYVDEMGKLWRVIGVWTEPTVEVEEVEPSGFVPGPDAIDITTGRQAEGTFLRGRQFGGVNGLMWGGFKRIHRQPAAKA